MASACDADIFSKNRSCTAVEALCRARAKVGLSNTCKIVLIASFSKFPKSSNVNSCSETLSTTSGCFSPNASSNAFCAVTSRYDTNFARFAVPSPKKVVSWIAALILSICSFQICLAFSEATVSVCVTFSAILTCLSKGSCAKILPACVASAFPVDSVFRCIHITKNTAASVSSTSWNAAKATCGCVSSSRSVSS